MPTALPKPRYDARLMADDMGEKGWNSVDLARRADVAISTVTRFLRGEHQTGKTAKKLAEALGRSVRRYRVQADARQTVGA